jgi:hypothetical protein
MKARDRQRAAGLDLAGDLALVERALGPERDRGRFGLAAIALLQRACMALNAAASILISITTSKAFPGGSPAGGSARV